MASDTQPVTYYKHMPFEGTQQQIRDRLQTVTRRRGKKFANLAAGRLFWACVKVGVKAEEIERLALLRCVSNTPERVIDIEKYEADEIAKSGFPGQSPEWLMVQTCRWLGNGLRSQVQRIEFEYVDGATA